MNATSNNVENKVKRFQKKKKINEKNNKKK